MNITGVYLIVKIGNLEVLRSPRLELVSSRHVLISRAEIDLPDPEGILQGLISVGQPVSIRFGYRGGYEHTFEGTVDGLKQANPQGAAAGKGQEHVDSITVLVAGLEAALATNLVTESFYGEPAATVAKRILAKSGLAVAKVSLPDVILPHSIFSSVSVWRAIRQLLESLERGHGYDLSSHALWLGEEGLFLSDGDASGPLYRVATGENLLCHKPTVAGAQNADATSFAPLHTVETVLLAGLRHSMLFHLVDSRRGIDETYRALCVRHILTPTGNRTIISYGGAYGWA